MKHRSLHEKVKKVTAAVIEFLTHKCSENFTPDEFPIYDEPVSGHCMVCHRKMKGDFDWSEVEE